MNKKWRKTQNGVILLGSQIRLSDRLINIQAIHHNDNPRATGSLRHFMLKVFCLTLKSAPFSVYSSSMSLIYETCLDSDTWEGCGSDTKGSYQIKPVNSKSKEKHLALKYTEGTLKCKWVQNDQSLDSSQSVYNFPKENDIHNPEGDRLGSQWRC